MTRISGPPTAGPKPARGPIPPWAYRALIVAMALLLGASGAIRARQDRRLSASEKGADVAPFPLARLPLEFGDWKARGDDMTFDAKTLQIAGCSDYVTRHYADERTGVVLTVLVAFGPAEKVVGHTPAVCYPAVGFATESGPVDHSIEVGEANARLRSYVFAKEGERLNVYVAFHHDGRWSPDASESRKKFRHDPRMFKLQIQRRIARGEHLEHGDPIEPFAAALLSEIDRAIDAAD